MCWEILVEPLSDIIIWCLLVQTVRTFNTVEASPNYFGADVSAQQPTPATNRIFAENRELIPKNNDS